MDENKLTLIGHLEELRKRLFISLIALAIGTAISFSVCRDILKILKLPAYGLIDKLAFFSPEEAFMSYFKIAIASGLIISMPVILYQLWAFISPAVDERFRRYSMTFVTFSLVSFIFGCIFAYISLLPAALKFLLGFGREDLVPVISVGKYISFSISIILCAGLVFEMPMLSFILSKLGAVNHIFLRRKFKYAVLVIFITAALITPTPDIFNMTLLALPMIFLYEISIWVSYFASPRKRR